MTLKRKWQLGDIVKAKHDMFLHPEYTTDITKAIIIPAGTFLEILERFSFLGNVSNILVGKTIHGAMYAYMVSPSAVVPLTRKENEIARLLYS
jgi:hypothetical protein